MSEEGVFGVKICLTVRENAVEDLMIFCRNLLKSVDKKSGSGRNW